MTHWWYYSMVVFAGMGVGLAAYHASGNQLVGLNIALGVSCFIVGIVSGIRLSIQNGKD